jgi:ADP-ribose pyrophosphatase YjhB (NUDIX family)
MTSIYQHTAENPFHISVGAVLVNGEGAVCVHTFPVSDLAEDLRATLSVDRLHILMRESLEEGETLSEAVLRGLQEEFGATGTIKRYLGSLCGRAFSPKGSFEKTTLYFLVELDQMGERPDDLESSSELRWIEPELLIEQMRAQRSDVRDDLDESKIIENYVTYR